jgi:hypothetical protein
MPLLSYIVVFIEIMVMLVGGLRYKDLPHPLRILEWLIIFNVGEAGIEWALIFFHRHNLWISHFYTLIEFTLLIFMFLSWKKSERNRLVLMASLIVFATFWIVSKFSFEPLAIADDWTSSVSKMLQIVFSAYLLLDVMNESDLVWTNDPRLWVATGIIIYSAGSLFMFALFNKMLSISAEGLKLVWSFNWMLMIISNLLFARGFLCKK